MTSATPHIDAAKAAIAKAREAYGGRTSASGRDGVFVRISLAVQDAVLMAAAVEREREVPHNDILNAIAIAIGDVISSQICTTVQAAGHTDVEDRAHAAIDTMLEVIADRAHYSAENTYAGATGKVLHTSYSYQKAGRA